MKPSECSGHLDYDVLVAFKSDVRVTPPSKTLNWGKKVLLPNHMFISKVLSGSGK